MSLFLYYVRMIFIQQQLQMEFQQKLPCGVLL